MRAIASLEMVIRPRGDESACPVSTSVLTSLETSGLRGEELCPAGIVGPRDLCGREACVEREPMQLVVGVEVPARGEWIGRRHRSLRLRRGRVDRKSTVRSEDAPHLFECPHRVWKEEE